MNKLFALAILATTSLSLAACGNEKKEVIDPLADKDFDGLCDAIDPTPDSNETGLIVAKDTLGELDSNEIKLTVDYRNFIFDDKPTYNKDLGMMMATISCFSYGFDGLTFATSKYTNAESAINPALVQFGFKDIERVVSTAGENDVNDICAFYFGNHIFKNDDKKYQVILASVDGYPSGDQWNSNLDLGADCDEYYSFSGEHPEWSNKKHHKGFDITASRGFEDLKTYINKVKSADVNDVVIAVTGHSRGGATSNLIGKLLKDNGYKSVVYCFNLPQTTQEEDEGILSSYTNIFNIVSTNDYISRYPFNFMGFTSYGTTLKYDLVANNAYYKSLFNHDFTGNTPEDLQKIDDSAENIIPTREDVYKFIEETDPDYAEYELCESEEAANKKLNELKADLKNMNLEGQVKFEVVINEDPLTKDYFPYKVQYYIMPNALFSFAAKAIGLVLNSGGITTELTTLILKGMPYLKRIIDMFVNNIDMEINFNAFACPHSQKTCIAGAYVAK